MQINYNIFVNNRIYRDKFTDEDLEMLALIQYHKLEDSICLLLHTHNEEEKIDISGFSIDNIEF